MTRIGTLIVIEGLDGTGKTVQSQRLVQRLKELFPHKQIEMRDFPRYDNPSTYGVSKYLRRQGSGLGYRSDVIKSSYAPSILYAIDRMDAAHSLDENGELNLSDILGNGGVVISNRYTQSNIGYQAAKIRNEFKRGEFIRWLYRLEYEWLLVPRPALVIFLDLPARMAQEAKLKQLATNGGSPDMHEADLDVFIRGRAAYLEAAGIFKDEWRVIDCLTEDNSRRKTEDEVAGEVTKAALSVIR